MRILGLDVGTHRIGVAVSDETELIASPLTYLKVGKKLEGVLGEIRALCLKHQVKTVVVGLPLSLSGGEGGQSVRRAKKMGGLVEEALDVPVVYWDERFTTLEAERLLVQADVGRKSRRDVVDKVAAALILQGYLDSQGQHA
jgi:putative Holliday junction resolvase